MKNLIQANELRVGNLYDNNGVFKKASPNTIEEVWEAPRSWCKPIPLTEEWLLKFGFEEDGNLFHNQIALYKNGIGGFNYNVNYFEYENLEEIKYVHQLQNLFFCLCGEELTIKQQEQ